MWKTFQVALTALSGKTYITHAWLQESSSNDMPCWPEKCIVLADGERQSPIKIMDVDGIACKDLPKLLFKGFHKVQKLTAMNTGHTMKVFLNYGEYLPTICGGPLKGQYSFSQFHFHWDRSEHVINSNNYAVEGHAVFFKSDYGSFDNALEYPDGLAVVGFFLEEATSCGTLVGLFNLLPSLQTTGAQVNTTGAAAFKWLALTQPTMSYYTYPGSLTSAPYMENVIFILFPQPGRITPKEKEKFGGLEVNSTVSPHEMQISNLRQNVIDSFLIIRN